MPSHDPTLLPYPAVWQKPYLAILQNSEWSTKELVYCKGNVSQSLDRVIGKTVYDISGSVSASDFVQVPVDDRRGLGVKGGYLYMMVCQPVGDAKFFTIHLDCTATNRMQGRSGRSTPFKMGLRLSFSDLYKETKMDGQTLKVPLQLVPGRWTVLAIDMRRLIETLVPYRNFVPPSERRAQRGPSGGKYVRPRAEKKVRTVSAPWRFHSLRAVTLGSSLRFWTMFSSDERYTSRTVPRNMRFPVSRSAGWRELYAWFSLPLDGGASGSTDYDEDDDETVPAPAPAPKPIATSVLGRLRTPVDQSRLSLSRTRGSEAAFEDDSFRAPSVAAMDRTLRTRTAAEVDTDIQQRQALLDSHIAIDATGEYKRFPADSLYVEPVARPPPGTDTDYMQPDPILSLENVIGLTGPQWNGGRNLCWAGSDIAFASDNLVVLMSPATRKQRFLMGHTGPVTVIAAGAPGSRLLATAQGGKSPVVRIWDTKTCACRCYLTAHDKKISSLSFSPLNGELAVAGLDQKGRQLLTVWDTSKVETGGTAVEIARQISEFDVRNLRFAPYPGAAGSASTPRLASCGKGSIRLWRVSKGHMPGRSLRLDPDNRQNFTELAFEAGYGPSDGQDKRLYVSSEEGWVFQVNFTKGTLESIFRLHNGPITSMVVNPGFCITGSADKYIRVWPLEFNDYYLQAQHAAPVSCVDVSPDGLSVLVGTSDGCVGVLDLQTSRFQSVVRAHTGRVRGVAVDTDNARFATVSEDGTIRIWSLDRYEQVYQFDCPEDKVTCAVFCPGDEEQTIVCGFASGYVRVCDIKATRMAFEFQQHEGNVVSLVFTPDGTRLMSVGTDGLVCIYDRRRKYEPVSFLKTTAGSPAFALGTVAKAARRVVAYVKSDKDPAFFTGFDVVTLQPLIGVDCGEEIAQLVAAPDGREVAALTVSGRMLRFDATDGKSVRAIQLRKACARDSRCWAVSPQNRYVACGTGRSTLSVWEYFADRPESKSLFRGPGPVRTQVFSGHSSAVDGACFLKDSSRLITISGSAVYSWKFMGNDKYPGGDDLTDVASAAEDKQNARATLPGRAAASEVSLINALQQDEERESKAALADGPPDTPSAEPAPTPSGAEDAEAGAEAKAGPEVDGSAADGKEAAAATDEKNVERAADGSVADAVADADAEFGAVMDGEGVDEENGAADAEDAPWRPSYQPIVASAASDPSAAPRSSADGIDSKDASPVPVLEPASVGGVARGAPAAIDGFGTPRSSQSHVSLMYGGQQAGDVAASPASESALVKRPLRLPVLNQTCISSAAAFDWKPSRGVLAFASGNSVVIQDLKQPRKLDSGATCPRRQRIFRAHDRSVTAICLSADASIVFTGSAGWNSTHSANEPDCDVVVAAWNVATGEQVGVLTNADLRVAAGVKDASPLVVRTVTFSAYCGMLCLTVDGAARGIALWAFKQGADKENARPGAAEDSKASATSCIAAFVPVETDLRQVRWVDIGGPYALATVGDDVALWTLSDAPPALKAQPLALRAEAGERFTSVDVAMVSERPLLIAATSRGRVVFVSLEGAPTELGSFRLDDGAPIRSVCCSAGGTLTVGSRGKELAVFSISCSRASTGGLGVRAVHVKSVAMTAGCRAVVTDRAARVAMVLSDDCGVLCVRLRAPEGDRVSVCAPLVSGHASRVRKAAFSAGSEYLASCGSEGSVKLWDTRLGSRGQRIMHFCVSDCGACESVAFHPKRLIVATAYSDGSVRVIDVKSFALLMRAKLHRCAIRSVAFLDRGELLLLGTADGRVIIVLWESNEVLVNRKIDAEGVAILDIRVLESDKLRRTWLAAHSNGNVSVWKGDKMVAMLDKSRAGDEEEEAKDFERLNSELTDFQDGEIDLHSLRKLLKERDVPMAVAAFHPKKPVVLCCSPSYKTPDSTVVAFDYEKNSVTSSMRVGGFPTSIDVSPDGQLVAFGYLDQRVQIFRYMDPESAGQEAILDTKIATQSDWVSYVKFSRDGRFLASTSYGQIMLTEIGTLTRG